MHKPFAKLFEHEETGQILITINQSSSDDPTKEAMMTCRIADVSGLIPEISFHFENWDDAAKAFEETDERRAVALGKSLLAQIKEMTS